MSDPVLALDATGDPLILGAELTAYDSLAEQAGNADRFVARFVDAIGHCSFTPAQTGSAFDALLLPVREGQLPMPGEQHLIRLQERSVLWSVAHARRS